MCAERESFEYEVIFFAFMLDFLKSCLRLHRDYIFNVFAIPNLIIYNCCSFLLHVLKKMYLEGNNLEIMVTTYIKILNAAIPGLH